MHGFAPSAHSALLATVLSVAYAYLGWREHRLMGLPKYACTWPSLRAPPGTAGACVVSPAHGYRLAAALEASQQFQCPVDHLRASKQRSAYATSSSQDYQQDDTAPLWNTMPNDNTCICFTASEQVLYTTSMPDSEEEWHE